jgi:hypothetical protein
MLLIAVLFLGTVVHITSARNLTPCEIARELYRHDIPRHLINDCKYYNAHPGNVSNNKIFKRFVEKSVWFIDLWFTVS